ncbi:hypothetical protein PY093_18535 [Cytobacillus sp. S13-E01]|uniref:hypothetical protein n=1 Tax=Cytobacillus sp. S13-E01 TaxID=3031326 RepID=UPI0023D83C0D|nr:hypothetical protein [Cytobacillus sp. S13-E01]MDF0728637.1 hypothetical protein [Cytobacillus sp. S13-E01]
MGFLNRLLAEKCPKCNKRLETNRSNILKSLVIKSCPDSHFQKEYHPAFETYIESDKVS